jgi:pullulanase/glycogen debranching enzyme
MLLRGDKWGRTQQGNNNAYCHDGPLIWFDWRWHVLANTTMRTPKNIWDPGEEPPLSDQERILVGGRSTIVLVAQNADSP